jgi:Protein of unknown function (DUF1800)
VSNTIWPTIAEAIAHAQQTTVAPLTWNPTDHLLSRCTFGPTADARAWVTKYGPDAWLTQQTAYLTTPPIYAANSTVAARGPLLSLSPFDLREWLKDHGNEYGWDAMDQLTEVTLGMQGWSPAQLYEVLVDFFSNHLNVPNHYGDVWNTRHAYDRDVIRRNAGGSFTTMLVASSKHPAMLTYLNLADSTKLGINENYGRELLELHTVGLNYTEDDVQNCARVLTGRTLDQYQHYVYDDYIHATGAIRVLDFTNANATGSAGLAAGDALLTYLAAHPFTAQNLARKLCLRLVSDAPSSDLVAAVAKAYLDNGTKIAPMVSTILRSTEFWESRGRKVRRPAENAIATLRVLGTTPSDWGQALGTLHWLTRDVGHCPLEWPAPNGYPDVAAAWRSAGSLLSLWNMHLGFAGGWWDGLKTAPDVAALYGGTPTNSGDAIDRLTRRLTGTTWSTADKATMQTFLGEPATTAMSSSRLQWMAYPLIAVILDSPYHALR